MEKQGGKPIICCSFVEIEKPPKPSQKDNGKKPDVD